MSRRYTAKPHLDRLMMRRKGSAPRPDCDPLVRSPQPTSHKELVSKHTTEEAVSEPKEERPGPREVVPYLPN